VRREGLVVMLSGRKFGDLGLVRHRSQSDRGGVTGESGAPRQETTIMQISS
jgi:hypothetical protein